MDLKLGDAVHPIDLIVFDCDGVLLESMSAKIEAFRQWVPEDDLVHFVIEAVNSLRRTAFKINRRGSGSEGGFWRSRLWNAR